MSKRRYYVIKEESSSGSGMEWKVKLEEGPVLSTHGSSRSKAIKEAKRLGRKNRRPVMVNYADGATGAAYHSVDDLT
jgi:hypothetical protein